MKIKRFIVMLCLCDALTAQMVLPASATGVTDIIRQLLTYYSHHQENAETDILRLLEQMHQLDPEQAHDWELIMASWQNACTELTLNPGVLPHGLPEDDSLCIVVMGFALNPGGSMRPELLGRLEATLASAKQYPNAFVLCTGGGTASANPGVTEAGQMAEWLAEQGIAPERIIVENRSHSTEQNAAYSIEILQSDYPQVTSLALVSSDYHLRRCHWLFESAIILAGLENSCSIVSNAAFEAGYVGESGFFAEAESMGNRFGLNLRYTTAPVLSKLTGITVTGSHEYQQGQALDLLVTAEYDSGFTRDVTEFAQISGYDPEIPGNQEPEISYSENGVTIAESIPVTVSPQSTEPATEDATTEATQSETDATEAVVITPVEPAERTKHIGWPVWILISLALPLPLLFTLRKKRGKYQK